MGAHTPQPTNPRRSDRRELAESVLDWPVILGALVTIPLLVVDQTHKTGLWHHVARVGDWSVWIVFVIDYVAILALAEDRRRYVRRHLLDLLVIVVTPPFLPITVQWIRVLRVLRVVRLLRLPRVLQRQLSIQSIEYAALLVAMTWFGGAAAFSAAEKVSYGDALYWAVGTLTTAGSGNVRATTPLAKVVACVLMAVGTGFFALVTGAIAQRFLAAGVEDLQTAASGVGLAAHSVELEETEILDQVRALSAQVQELETALQQRLG